MRCVVCVFKIARQRSEELKRKNQDYLSTWLFLSEREIRVNDSTHAGSSSFKQSDMCKKKRVSFARLELEIKKSEGCHVIDM